MEDEEEQAGHIESGDTGAEQGNETKYPGVPGSEVRVGQESRLDDFVLGKNPENGGIPRIASQPIKNANQVIFMTLNSPPKRRMLTCSLIACMTAPADRNS